eukprot:Clim_evm15s39 gene=Clim_evmTU15s39
MRLLARAVLRNGRSLSRAADCSTDAIHWRQFGSSSVNLMRLYQPWICVLDDQKPRTSIDVKSFEQVVEIHQKNIESRYLDVPKQHAVFTLPQNIEKLARKRREIVQIQNELHRLKNSNARDIKEIAKDVKNGDPHAISRRGDLIAKGKMIRERMQKVDGELMSIENDLHENISILPNLSHPMAEELTEPTVVDMSPRDKPRFEFPVRDHLELAGDRIDFKTAGNMTGHAYYLLKGDLALLELALVQFALQEAVNHGFEVIIPPDVVRDSYMEACGFFPRDEATQIYRLHETKHRGLCLAGTSEVTIAASHAGQTLRKESLPIRTAAFSHCFRAEAGGYGATARGLYRVHQFSKVELFVVSSGYNSTHPEQSAQQADALLDEMLALQRRILDKLELHYRVLDMPPHELGASASRKFDIEAWMPARRVYGEVTSASLCTDYQARRLAIKAQPDGMGESHHCYTLNATALAVPRCILALLETHQQKDGSIKLPDALVPFFLGQHSPKIPAKS